MDRYLSPHYCLLQSTPAFSDDEIIYACAQKNSGQLRVIEEGEDCSSSEEPLSWNREGPPGDPGISSLEIVKTTTNIPTDESNRNGILASTFCPVGMHATGGGFRVNGDGVYVKASQPFPGLGAGNVTPIGWHAVFAYLQTVPNPVPPSTQVTVWAVCAWPS